MTRRIAIPLSELSKPRTAGRAIRRIRLKEFPPAADARRALIRDTLQLMRAKLVEADELDEKRTRFVHSVRFLLNPSLDFGYCEFIMRHDKNGDESGHLALEESVMLSDDWEARPFGRWENAAEAAATL